MTPPFYSYRFARTVPADELAATLALAVVAAECVVGESRARLDLVHAYDPGRRAVVIDASTPAGRVLCRLFVGLATREFGHGAVAVRRVAAQLEPATV